MSSDFMHAWRTREERLEETLRVCLPGKVVSYDVATQMAVVRPLLLPEWSEVGDEMPPIPSVPVAFPKGGGYEMSWPLSAGDQGWLLFADQSLEEFLSRAETTKPRNPRRHDLNDAVFLPAHTSRPTAHAQASSTNLVIARSDGTVQLELTTGGKVEVTGGGSPDAVALATLVLGELNAIRTAFNNHVHGGVTTGGGTSATPAPQISPFNSMGATKLSSE